MNLRPIRFLTLTALFAIPAVGALSSTKASSPTGYGAWKNGPSADPGYFPIAVWLQDPKRAPEFEKAGINLYVGLWQGPTEPQLAALKAAGMRVICEQNAIG